MSAWHPDPTEDQIRELAEGTLAEWLEGYQDVGTHQIQLRPMSDGTWHVDDSDGVRAAGERGRYRITVTVERLP